MVGLLIPLAKVRTNFHSAKFLCEKKRYLITFWVHFIVELATDAWA
jgi:hypothetical protein